jgi:hypothetical protein
LPEVENVEVEEVERVERVERVESVEGFGATTKGRVSDQANVSH